jgi:hypothetical protein
MSLGIAVILIDGDKMEGLIQYVCRHVATYVLL